MSHRLRMAPPIQAPTGHTPGLHAVPTSCVSLGLHPGGVGVGERPRQPFPDLARYTEVTVPVVWSVAAAADRSPGPAATGPAPLVNALDLRGRRPMTATSMIHTITGTTTTNWAVGSSSATLARTATPASIIRPVQISRRFATADLLPREYAPDISRY